jgi:plastocyanin
VPHAVAGTERVFKGSKAFDTNGSYSLTFDRPGTYDYFCSIHPVMTGQVVVTQR